MTEPRPTDAGPPAVAPEARAATVDEARWIRRSIWLGRAIVLCAVVATVATLILVQRFGRTYEDGLEVTTESAELVADSVEPAQLLAADLGELAVALADGIEGTRTLLATTSGTIDSIGEASSTNLADTADGAAGVADDLAGVLETIERFIPGNTQSVAEELRTLADGLEPVADQLRDLGDELRTGSAQLDDADATLAELSVSVASASAGIDQLAPAFDRLETTAYDLAARADEATDRIGTDMWLLRMVVIVVGLAIAFAGMAIERFARHLAEFSPFVSGV